MKNQIKQISKLTLVLIATLVVAGVAQAEECASSANVLKDTVAMGEMISEHINSNREANDKRVVSEKFHRVDTEKEGNEIFSGIGHLTNRTDNITELPFAAGTVIGHPCYVIAARHTEKINEDGSKMEVGDQYHFSVGQGKTCEKPFKYQIPGKVVTFGGRTTRQDWAIIKLDRPVGRDIRPMKFGSFAPTDNTLILRGGRPHNLAKGDFRHVQLQYTRVAPNNNLGSDLVPLTDKGDYPGLSGAPSMFMYKNSSGQKEVALAGIHIGKSKDGRSFMLSVDAIREQLEEVAPEIYKKIVAGQDPYATNSCD